MEQKTSSTSVIASRADRYYFAAAACIIFGTAFIPLMLGAFVLVPMAKHIERKERRERMQREMRYTRDQLTAMKNAG